MDTTFINKLMKISLVQITFICLSLLFLTNASHAQQIDSIQKAGILDSLPEIRLKESSDMLAGESYLENDSIFGLNENDILALFEGNEVETSDFNARSKRIRVDELLRALEGRPGQLRFNGGATSIFQALDSAEWLNYYGTGSFDIYAHTLLGEGILVFFDLEAIGGNGPNERFATFSPVNSDAGTTRSADGLDRLTILEAWSEFSLFEDAIQITAGKIDLTNYFDNNASANDETMQFINGAFVNNAAFAVPSNSPGIRIQTTLFKRYHLHFGLSSLDNSGTDIFTNLYGIGSLAWTILPGTDFESNLRLYGYQHPEIKNGYGWGTSIDLLLFKTYNLFGRYGSNQAEIVDYWPIESSWSVGARFVRPILKRTLAIGIAYGEQTSFDESLNHERVVELYGRRQVNEWIHISPHVQWIQNAAGTNNDYRVYGIRTHFNF
jgi:hypothetical protein